MLQLVTNLDVLVAILLISSALGYILTLIGSKWLLKREAKLMITEAIDQLFGAPATKRAMSIIGQESGDKRHKSRIVDDMATDFLNNPNMKGVKMASKALGFDLDKYIEEEGASDTLEGIKGLGKMLGIDVMKIIQNPAALAEILNREGSGKSGDKGPYL